MQEDMSSNDLHHQTNDINGQSSHHGTSGLTEQDVKEAIDDKKRQKIPGSYIWIAFEDITNENKLRCKICNKEFATSGRSGNFWKHLLSKHQVIYNILSPYKR
ncbi:hypothetical protein ACQ4LE_002813, partial [Meloidogyne hapla]